MRPQPGNALQEGCAASEKGECWKRNCGVRLVFFSALLRVLARGGGFSETGLWGQISVPCCPAALVEKFRRAPRGEVVSLVCG